MTAPVKQRLLKTIKSTLYVYFTGIRCGDAACKQHHVIIHLTDIMFDATDDSLAQYALLVLQGRKAYAHVSNVMINEESVAIEIS